MAIRAIPVNYDTTRDVSNGRLELTAVAINSIFESIPEEAKITYLGHISMKVESSHSVNDIGAIILVNCDKPELLPTIDVPQEKPYNGDY